MKSGFGVGFANVPRNRWGLNTDGLIALNTLKTSPIASTRAVPTSRNDFDTRRFSCEKDVPRPQLIVLQEPMSFAIGLLLASKPSNANATLDRSLLIPFWLRSTPWMMFNGIAVRNRKIGANWTPAGSSMMELKVIR